MNLNGKRVLLRAPLLTQSGYGVHARQIAKWLLSKNIDLDCQVLPWGDTPWTLDRDAYDGLIGQIMGRTKDIQKGYDVTFQLQLPNEWDPSLGFFNYGITAGVETDVCNKDWLKSCHKMQHVIVPSSFAKKAFLNTSKLYNEQSLAKKISVVPESYPICYDSAYEDINRSQFDEKFNFLIVGQITSHNSLIDRKNVLATVKALCEEFRSNDDSSVGIVVKTNSTRNNSIDLSLTQRVLTEAISQSRKEFLYPRVHLIHGNMTDKEMRRLYTDASIKALVSLTRGEGYGLPLLEVAALGLPIIASAGGGYEEFLGDSYTKVNGRFVQIPKEKVDNNIFVQGAKWFNPSVEEFKAVCRSATKDISVQQSVASKLRTKITSQFSEQKVFELYDKLVEETYSNRVLMLTFFLCIAVIAEAAVICGLAYKLYTLGLKVLAFEDAVENCLDFVEKAYQETYAVTRSNDSLSSDPRLHIAVKSLRNTRVAIMAAATILSSEFDQDDLHADKGDEDKLSK